MSQRAYPLIASILALSLGAPAAIGAEATTALNVRSGPGPDHPVVDVLQPGETVRVGPCSYTGNWCQISHPGPDGWVYARYLDGVVPDEDVLVTEIVVPAGTVSVEFTVAVDEPAVIELQTVDLDDAEPDRPRRNAVCFYEHPNYGGHSFCVSEGAGEQALGSFWNDRISAIRVAPGVVVKICDTEGLRGRCADVSYSYAYVGDNVNDIISSYQVY